MSRLTVLHQGIRKLQRHRRMVRVGATASWYVSGLLVGLCLLYLVDRGFDMGRVERVILMMVIMGGWIWGFYQWMWPSLRKRESEVDIALLVEQRLGLSNDLIAALQFEKDLNQADKSSQSELKEMVIEAAEEVSEDLDYMEGTSSKPFRRGAFMLLCCVMMTGMLALASPQAFSIFMGNRLLLGMERYPTQTRIQSAHALVAEQERPLVLLDRREALSPEYSVPRGYAIDFRVYVEGERPESGQLKLTSTSDGDVSTLTLEASQQEPGLYSARLDRAMVNMKYRVEVGDDYSDEGLLEIKAPPKGTLKVKVTYPSYTGLQDTVYENVRQIEVLEGARIHPVLSSDQPIKQASMSIGDQSHALKANGGQSFVPVEQGAWQRVTEDQLLSFDLLTTDGLKMEQPLALRVNAIKDRSPKAAVAVEVQRVLPRAQPRIRYQALDDYSLRSIALEIEVHRSNEQLSKKVRNLVSPKSGERQWKGETRLDLSSLELEEGDLILARLLVTDERSENGFTEARSNTIRFEVTDLDGVLSSVDELDKSLDEKLEAVIKTQLEMGVKP